MLKDMREKKSIEPVESSPWISPVMISVKSSGKLCLCIDLRSLNKAICVDAHPLPNLHEMLSTLAGAQEFSCLGLASACHQVVLHEESKNVTALLQRVCLDFAGCLLVWRVLLQCSRH